MDPAAIALLMMELTCASQIALGQSDNAMVAVAVPASASTSGYITLDGHPNGGTVRVIRAGQIVAVLKPKDFKKTRSHPELDFKLQPGDIVQFAESWY